MGKAQAAPQLPIAAQTALDKGVIAARAADYLQAILFFEDARKAAPDASIVYLNLGLAESKIAGRELRAIAWFGAYQAAKPAAANAGVVKAQISALSMRQRANKSGLLATAETLARLIPESKPEWREIAWRDIAIDRALNGEIAAAEKAARLVKLSFLKTQVALGIADAQIGAGDMAGARRTLESALRSASRIASEPQQGILTPAGAAGQAYGYIAAAQAEAGDLSGAFSTANRTPGLDWKARAQILIGKVQAKAGDMPGARKTFTAAKETVGRMPDSPGNAAYKVYLQTEIAKAQSGGGDPDPQVTCSPLRAGTGVKASDWIAILTDSDPEHNCPLNTSPFLDLPAHLKALPQQNNGISTFIVFEKVLSTLGSADRAVNRMLARQFGP